MNTGAAVLFALAGFCCLVALTRPTLVHTPEGEPRPNPDTAGFAFLAGVFLFCGLVAL